MKYFTRFWASGISSGTISFANGLDMIVQCEAPVRNIIKSLNNE